MCLSQQTMQNVFRCLHSKHCSVPISTCFCSRLDAGAGLLTAQCIAKVEEIGEVASDVMEVMVMDTTTSTTTTTTTSSSQPLGPPVVFGVRPGSVLRPSEEVVLTCSAVVEGEGNLQWMVDDQLRGEGAELHKKDGKLISSWK